jgi:hypothetical protein
VRQAASPGALGRDDPEDARDGRDARDRVRSGQVLAGMTKRIWPEAQSFSLADRASLEQALKC